MWKKYGTLYWVTVGLMASGIVAFAPIMTVTRSHTVLRAAVVDERCDVAVFGGGFGGLYTAISIARQARSKGRRLEVALVTPSDRFVFLPLLYDLVVGTASESEVCPALEELLEDTGIRHVQASFDNYVSPDLYSAYVTRVNGDKGKITFRASVIAVGATPQSSLASIPGAATYTQPFYTAKNARETKMLLEKMERRIRSGLKPRIAIVGGGYGGVELAACVKRRLQNCDVTLLTRGAPMKGTRAEPLVNKALSRLGVQVEVCAVKAVEKLESAPDNTPKDKVKIIRTSMDDEAVLIDDDQHWDAVLWTAGSGPAYPVCDGVLGLKQIKGSGRLEIDSTLRCIREESSVKPPVWALGDCSQIVDATASYQVPRTAQAAIQQADVVASNVLADIRGAQADQVFEFQDLGSMLTLGGPNAAVLAPKENSILAPLFSTLLDTARVGLDLADEVLNQISKSTAAERSGMGPLVDSLGLSLGGYGLGVDTESAPGTLSGTLSGAARRAIYSLRMPTAKQRAKSAVLGALSTATALSKEISDQRENKAATTKPKQEDSD